MLPTPDTMYAVTKVVNKMCCITFLDILGSLFHHPDHRHHHLENPIKSSKKTRIPMGYKHHRIARKGDISFAADNSGIYTKPGIICPVVR